MDDGPPVFSADSSCPQILWIPLALLRFHLSDSHTLRSAFPCGSVNLEILIAVLTPDILLHPVWPLPRSLATTCGISFDFSSSGYLDVSVPRVPRIYLWIQYMLRGSSPRGFPHSDIRGSKLICSSPRLFAACHVLRRLPMPRHPPYALVRLNSLFCLFSRFLELLELRSENCVRSYRLSAAKLYLPSNQKDLLIS